MAGVPNEREGSHKVVGTDVTGMEYDISYFYVDGDRRRRRPENVAPGSP